MLVLREVCVWFGIVGIIAVPPPIIDVTVLSATTLRITCEVIDNRPGLRKIYRQHNDNLILTMSVTHTDHECEVASMLSMEQVYCACERFNRVVCEVSDKNNTLKFDHWKCAIFINKIPVFSNLKKAHDNAILSLATSEGTLIPIDVHRINTLRTEQVHIETTIENSDLTTVSLRYNISTIALKESSNMWETTPSTVDIKESRNSTIESLIDHVSTSSNTHNHTLDDTTGPNESLNILQDGFYQRFITISATCIAVLIAATILICVYRNYKRNSELSTSDAHALEAVIPPNDGIIQISDLEMFSEELTEGRNSRTDHYERFPTIRMSPMADSFPLPFGRLSEDLDSEQEDVSVHNYETIIDEK